MTEVISVRFRGGCKNYFFDPKGIQIKMGDQVVVETAQGAEFATCTEGNHEVEDSAIGKPLCAGLRMATENDRRIVEYNRKRESEAFDICEKKIADHGLDMKLVNVSVGFDGNKIIFYFTADGRVDFRELVRDLASVFRARIELRQIGVRDEAKMIGGLGICGRPFCCSEFLDGFMPVSIKMAKTQNLSLNPAKISGTCGRLMCCLKYEQYAYEDAARRMPKVESFVQTPDGPGNVKSIDLLRETVKVSLDSAPEGLKQYRNCEIRVLRNGKGSRDGIDIGAPTERYVEEKEDELLVAPIIATPYLVDSVLEEAPVREKMGEESEDGKLRHRSRRGRKGGGKAAAQERSGVVAEKSEKKAKKAEKSVEKAEKTEKSAEPKEEKKNEGRSRRRRGERRGAEKNTEKKTDKQPAPEKAEKAEKQPRFPRKPRAEGEKAAAPAPEKQSGETGEKRRRPHHRGGRRRNKGGEGGNAAPKAE